MTKKHFISSIQFKFSLIVALLLIVVNSLFTFYFLQQQEKSIRKGMESKARSIATSLSLAGAKVVIDNLYMIQESLASFSRIPDVSEVLFIDETASISASKDPMRIGESLSDDRFFKEAVAGKKEILEYYKNKSGLEMLGILEPMMLDSKIHGWIRLDLSMKETEESIKSSFINMVILAGLFTASGIIISIFFAKRITTPLNKVVAGLKDIAEGEGDLTKKINISSNDEVGQLVYWFNSFGEKVRVTISHFTSSANQLLFKSDHLSSASQKMSDSFERITKQASAVSVATEQANQNVRFIAESAEEMSVTIKSISSNLQEATAITSQAVKAAETAGSDITGITSETSRIISQAVKVADSTNLVVTKLGESSAEIGEVVKAISSIAGKTNLLALNATIEAARAGEAGKGFAVVANEVKELAKSTAKATEEIGFKIDKIQSDSQGAVSAIREIGNIINQVNQITSTGAEKTVVSITEIKKIVTKINEVSTTIAGAVEEQAVTTSEISRNAVEASKETEGVVKNITEVASSLKNMSDEESNILEFSRNLSKMASELEGLVKQYKS